MTLAALSDHLAGWLLLAQEEGAKVAGKGDAAKTVDAPGFSSMLPALVGIMVLFWLLILRPQKNKEKDFRSMVDNLKERDRVVTIGGIHGVVTGVQREAGTVSIRVDESTGTKIRVGTSAIAKVITDEETAEAPNKTV